jgi:hypothetical protein
VATFGIFWSKYWLSYRSPNDSRLIGRLIGISANFLNIGFIYGGWECFFLLLNHGTLYFGCHFVCHMPRRFLNLFALDPSMRCNSAIDASALKHVKLLIIDFSCYITSWVLLQDVLFELLECCVHRFSDLVLLIPVLLFCDSTNSMMLPNKYEFCCCLLLDACALASCQNTDFSCRIVAWLGKLLYECLV